MFEKLGRFEIKGLLGRGAMGEVYLGVDPSLGREVAIKTILASAAQGEEAKRRFSREAKAAGVLNHPNIVTIYEFGEDQGVLYIAMERVRGQDLEEMLRQRSITPGEALEVLAQVCDGLEFAHRNQVIHRDIKPSNVRVLRDGRRLQAKVMDFGVARLQNSDMTATGTVVGTVSYMAPEYIRTGRPDGRSDLFAVGVMLYECMSGRRPFEGDTTPTILYKIVNEPPDPVDLSQLREISPAIRSVLDTALAKNPDERYQTADEFAHALRAAKDPTWQGRVQEATVQIASKSAPKAVPPPIVQANAAPTAAVPLSHAAPTAAIAVAKPSRSHVGLILAVTGLGGLLMAGVGGYVAYRWSHGPKSMEASVNGRPSPAAAEPPAPPVQVPAPATPASEPAPQPAPVPQPAILPTPTPAPAVPPKKTPEPAPKTPAAPAVVPAPAPAPKPVVPEPKSPAVVAPVPVAPEPPAAFAPPTSERKNASNVSMSDAIALADSDPGRSVEGLRAAIAADPGNANAYAWLVVVLYGQGRYQEIPPVLAKARQHGIPKARLLANMRFRMAMQNDRLNHRISGGTGADE